MTRIMVCRKSGYLLNRCSSGMTLRVCDNVNAYLQTSTSNKLMERGCNWGLGCHMATGRANPNDERKPPLRTHHGSDPVCLQG